MLLHRQPTHVRKQIMEAIGTASKRSTSSIGFFSVQHSFEFIHYELVNFRAGEFDTDLSEEVELYFFKAYRQKNY